MGKCLMLAVAGAGKTTFLINKLDLERRFLLVTYTDNNVKNLKNSIIRKYGYLPSNIKVLSYFVFLYNFCYKPFLSSALKARGINWKDIPGLYLKKNQRQYYLTQNRYLYHNRIALICQDISEKITSRLEKYYDCFYYDEVQDLAGNDFNLMLQIASSKMETIFVGDFYQHTFDTSRDGKVNGTLHEDCLKYKKRWKLHGFTIDESTLQKSYRCSQSVCDYVRQNLGIEIYSHNTIQSSIVLLEEKSDIETIIRDNSVPKLFLWKADKYNCFAMNWGESKGLNDFVDVCIVLNSETKKFFDKGKLKDLKPMTKKKLYVACTRAKRNIYFVLQEQVKAYLS